VGSSGAAPRRPSTSTSWVVGTSRSGPPSSGSRRVRALTAYARLHDPRTRDQALAFYRSVGASLLVRFEELLAAAG